MLQTQNTLIVGTCDISPTLKNVALLQFYKHLLDLKNLRNNIAKYYNEILDLVQHADPRAELWGNLYRLILSGHLFPPNSPISVVL